MNKAEWGEKKELLKAVGMSWAGLEMYDRMKLITIPRKREHRPKGKMRRRVVVLYHIPSIVQQVQRVKSAQEAGKALQQIAAEQEQEQENRSRDDYRATLLAPVIARWIKLSYAEGGWQGGKVTVEVPDPTARGPESVRLVIEGEPEYTDEQQKTLVRLILAATHEQYARRAMMWTIGESVKDLRWFSRATPWQYVEGAYRLIHPKLDSMEMAVYATEKALRAGNIEGAMRTAVMAVDDASYVAILFDRLFKMAEDKYELAKATSKFVPAINRFAEDATAQVPMPKLSRRQQAAFARIQEDERKEAAKTDAQADALKNLREAADRAGGWENLVELFAGGMSVKEVLNLPAQDTTETGVG